MQEDGPASTACGAGGFGCRGAPSCHPLLTSRCSGRDPGVLGRPGPSPWVCCRHCRDHGGTVGVEGLSPS